MPVEQPGPPSLLGDDERDRGSTTPTRPPRHPTHVCIILERRRCLGIGRGVALRKRKCLTTAPPPGGWLASATEAVGHTGRERRPDGAYAYYAGAASGAPHPGSSESTSTPEPPSASALVLRNSWKTKPPTELRSKARDNMRNSRVLREGPCPVDTGISLQGIYVILWV